MARYKSGKNQAAARNVPNLDPNLLPRVAAFGQNNDLDLDDVVEYLRGAYKEYQRKPMGPFITMVARAISNVQDQGKISKPELKLQELEQRHMDCMRVLEAPPSSSIATAMFSLYTSPDKPAVPSPGLLGSASAPGLAPENGAGKASPEAGPRPRRNATSPTQCGASGDATTPHQPSSVPPGRGTARVGCMAILPSKNGIFREAYDAILTADASAWSPPASKAPEDPRPPTGSNQRLVARSARDTSAQQPRGPAGRLGKRTRATAGLEGAQSAITAPRQVCYSDLAGIDGVLQDVKELIERPIKHPEVYAWLGVDPPRGVLLHGAPGCGKTVLAHAIAHECNVPFLRVSAPEIVSGMSGESEAKLRSIFQEAAAVAPCIIFIDEVDAIAPKRETAQREMERRIVAQMLTCMDDLSASHLAGEVETEASGGGTSSADGPSHRYRHVVVIGATNRPDSLDPALRRAGRFDREISLGIPSESARAQILQVLAKRLRLAGDFNFLEVARQTPGFVGADLAALTQEAASLAVRRVFAALEQQGAASETDSKQLLSEIPPADPADEAMPDADGPGKPPERGQLGAAQMEQLAITMADFCEAVGKVQPSVRREGFATTSSVTWADVGALEEVREELSFAITQPIRHPARFAALGLTAPQGVLLFGPPGCGKTLLAKAVASESGANFMSIKGPELLNKWVGESERAVRQLFSRARAAAPCVLFFDELDALAPRRAADTSQSSERVVNQLLTEMDGMEGRAGVFLVAATNRPDIIDPALLRPGRLDKVLYVPLPSPAGRESVLATLARQMPVGADVDLASVARSPLAEGLSGADLQQLLREAAVAALKESLARPAAVAGEASPVEPAAPRVCARHFQHAFSVVTPSVSAKDERVYAALRGNMRAPRHVSAVL